MLQIRNVEILELKNSVRRMKVVITPIIAPVRIALATVQTKTNPRNNWILVTFTHLSDLFIIPLKI